MIDINPNAVSFATEDEARAYIIANQCDPGVDNLARVGTGWVVVDSTPRPDLANHKLAKDETHAAALSALDKVAALADDTTEFRRDVYGRLSALESELAALRTEVRESSPGNISDVEDSVGLLGDRLTIVENTVATLGEIVASGKTSLE